LKSEFTSCVNETCLYKDRHTIDFFCSYKMLTKAVLKYYVISPETVLIFPYYDIVEQRYINIVESTFYKNKKNQWYVYNDFITATTYKR
jgi:bisphosphoglycerate-independent phosphoglycerate mutase (AlkP superfamily)